MFHVFALAYLTTDFLIAYILLFFHCFASHERKRVHCTTAHARHKYVHILSFLKLFTRNETCSSSSSCDRNFTCITFFPNLLYRIFMWEIFCMNHNWFVVWSRTKTMSKSQLIVSLCIIYKFFRGCITYLVPKHSKHAATILQYMSSLCTVTICRYVGICWHYTECFKRKGTGNTKQAERGRKVMATLKSLQCGAMIIESHMFNFNVSGGSVNERTKNEFFPWATWFYCETLFFKSTLESPH